MSLIKKIIESKLSLEEAINDDAIGAADAAVDDSQIPAAGTETDPVAGAEETPAIAPDDNAEVDPSATPAEETPAEEVPAEETPAEEVPAEETPAEETPAEEVPAEETPAPEVDPAAAPAEETPAPETEVAPEAAAPADEPAMEPGQPSEVPEEETPAEEIPAADPEGTGVPGVDEVPEVDGETDTGMPPIDSDDTSQGAPEGGEGGDGFEGTGVPSPDAEVTPLPEGVDPEGEVEDTNLVEDAEEIEDLDESDEQIAAKADAVADLSTAQASLEEIVAELEASLQDGGLTPEGVVAAQGAVNDILGDVGEEAVGLPSTESFENLQGRLANTKIAMESIGAKVKEVGGKIWDTLVSLFTQIYQRLVGDKGKLIRHTQALQAWFKNPVFTKRFPLVGDPIVIPAVACQKLHLMKPVITARQVRDIADAVASCTGYAFAVTAMIDQVARGDSGEIQSKIGQLMNSVGTSGGGVVHPLSTDGVVQKCEVKVDSSVDARDFVNTTILMLDKTIGKFDALTSGVSKAIKVAEAKRKAPEGELPANHGEVTQAMNAFRAMSSFAVSASLTTAQIAQMVAKKATASIPKAA